MNDKQRDSRELFSPLEGRATDKQGQKVERKWGNKLQLETSVGTHLELNVASNEYIGKYL